MSRLPWFALLLLWIVPSLAPPVWGQAAASRQKPNPEISVQVRNPDGTPAPRGVLVVLERDIGGTVDTCQTTDGGKCHFSCPDLSIYLVRIHQHGYKDVEYRVDVSSSPRGYASLTLTPIPGAEPPPPPKGAQGPSVSALDLSTPEEARKEFDQGQQSLQKNDLDAGITHIKKAIELHDQFPQAYTLLGMAYNEQKKWKDAQGALEKAVQQDPKAVEAYFQLGASLNQQKDSADAVKALNQGLQLNPDAPDAAAAHYELGRAYMALGQWQDAEPHTAKTIAAQPEFPLAHWLMAQIMLKKGDGQGAINEFQTYLKLDPNGSFAPSVRAVIPKIEAAMQKK